MSETEREPMGEVRCVHVDQCGACPLMTRSYEEQRGAKVKRLERALERYGMRPTEATGQVAPAAAIAGYRRRAKLVVTREPSGRASVGLYRRNDNQSVIDIPGCKVLSPTLMELVSELRALATDTPAELACLLSPIDRDEGVLVGLDARELVAPARGEDGGADEGEVSILLTLVLAAERAAPQEELREAARLLRERLPVLGGVAASLRFASRQQSGSSELIGLTGASELRDALGGGPAGTYQLVSHSSFLHVHRGQAARLYELMVQLAARDGEPGRVLDLYGGTGAIALTLARAGHSATLVESYPPAASLALRAAQSQRLPVEVITGDVASVTKALGAAGSRFDVVVANPPRRGLSPAAREAVAALKPSRILYVACDLDNLSRDLDHLARLGYRLRALHPLDMLPLTEEVEVVAVLEPAEVPRPHVLYQDEAICALDKPPHEPVQDQPEYPVSLVGRARRSIDGGNWVTVLKIDPSTSGVCLFARDERSAIRWTDALSRTGRLVYLAAARGVTPAKGAITRELRAEDGTALRQARTRYRRLAIGGGHSILRVVPERRHTHQIRRHLAAVGHPVLGDMRYGHAPTNRYFEEKHGLDRSFLHLVRVELDHPDTGERLLIEAPLPPDLRSALVRASDESVLRFLENKRALGGAGAVVKPRGSVPQSEPSSSSMAESFPEGVAASYRHQPPTVVSTPPLELDDAPRTIRGELLHLDDDEEG